MDELIQGLVADYMASRVTWHDIQDIVAAYLIEQDNKRMTTNWRTIRARNQKETIILHEIEKRIHSNE